MEKYRGKPKIGKCPPKSKNITHYPPIRAHNQPRTGAEPVFYSCAKFYIKGCFLAENPFIEIQYFQVEILFSPIGL